MTDEPDNVVLRHLHDIRATLDDHTKQFHEVRQSLARLEKQLSDEGTIVRYTLGQSEATQFRQSEQQAKLDEVFEKLEELLSKPQPT
jgi:hypothetical protein